MTGDTGRRWYHPPGGEWTFTSAMSLLLGAAMIAWGAIKGRPLGLLSGMGAFWLVAGALTWFRHRRARAVAVTCFAASALFMVYVLLTRGFSWGALIGAACCVWGAVTTWRDLRPDDDIPDPLISFVLLLRAPRHLEAPILSNIVSAAWGGRYDPEDDGDPAGRWVVGESPLFAVKSSEAVFIVHNHDARYFDDPDAVAEALPDLRVRRAVEEHRAWMAVDLIQPVDPSRPRESFYPQIARLIAEMAGDDCLALLHPESGRVNAWDPSLEEKLKGPNPLDDATAPVNPPVVRVDENDPRMKAAVDEARRRFPEFVDAFKRRDGENFTVKAPVSAGGDTEFIWIDVTGLEPGYVHGTLANEPVKLGSLKLGDRVEVPVADINDWAYFRDGAPVGLFTPKVLAAMTQEKRGASGRSG